MILKIVLIATLSIAPLFAISALEIAQKVHDRDEGDNLTSKMKMILIDKNKKKRVKKKR